jgi:glycosyltransferase involved in cell wall biosynthesis
MNSLPAVEVLLATCNGERFLREQIDSILAQDYEPIRILARDDGSTDSTVAILTEYEERFPGRFRVMPAGDPTGSARDNFLLLMKESNAEHICFADQDDVWLGDKVSRTIRAMEELEARWGTTMPLLVFTDLRVVDENLETLHESFWEHMAIQPERIDKLAKLLVQSVVTGCTAMINRALLELSLRMPKEASMHDRWFALLASVLGRSSAVKEQTVLYRQHDRNVLGTGRRNEAGGAGKRGKSLLEQVRQFRDSRSQILQWRASQRQAASLLTLHGAELSAAKRDLVSAYLRCETGESRIVRIATLLRYGFYYEGLWPNLRTVAYLWKLDPGGTGRR